MPNCHWGGINFTAVVTRDLAGPHHGYGNETCRAVTDRGDLNVKHRNWGDGIDFEVWNVALQANENRVSQSLFV
jgi:hypothetical protein